MTTHSAHTILGFATDACMALLGIFISSIEEITQLVALGSAIVALGTSGVRLYYLIRRRGKEDDK